MTPVDAILSRLLALHPKKIDLSLVRMWRILERLGSPERRLPPVIHVAGTNGKGSTIAFMRAVLEGAGRRVHVYTSPHLVRFNERFRLGGSRDGRGGAGRLVEDGELADVLAECERVNEGEAITVFEITTAAAFVLFSRHAADVLLLEVGLGGRLDATNVVEHPIVSVITPVSIDHIDFLGDTVAKIAAEKAGILRRGVPAVLGPQPAEALRVIEQTASRLDVPVKAAGQHWMAGEERGRLVYQDEDGLIDLPAPRLAGRHQFDNAGAAIAALRAAHLGLPVSAYEAIVRAEWPARLQRLTQGPLVAMAPDGSEVWLDGGHNPDGGRAVAGTLADLEERVSRPLVLVLGMLSSKDADGFIRNFAGLARRVVTVPIHQDAAVSPEVLADAVRQAGIPAEPRDSVADALTAIAGGGLEPPPRILITGSLYLAGEVLSLNDMPPG
jgi:dihydrofolate synthase/folylpolyglutamate synthase